MMKIAAVTFGAVLGWMAVTLQPAHAQSYPARPVTVLCWSAPGSPVDLYARIMAKLLAAELGQNVIV